MLHSVAEALEAELSRTKSQSVSLGAHHVPEKQGLRERVTYPCVAGIVLHDFSLVQPAKVTLVQRLGKVPVV